MNRKDVVDLLKEVLSVANQNAESIDEFYKEFQSWNYALQKAVTLRRTGKNDVPNVPPTPGAHLRVRRRLSTIGESPGGGQNDSRASKIAGNISKSSPKHCSKRAKLSLDDEDDNETINNTTGNTIQDLQSVPSVYVEDSLKSVHEENDVNEKSEGKRGGRRRKTKRSTILGRNLTVPGRNTRSNARITRSTVSQEAYNDCNRDSLNGFTVTSLMKSIQKIGANEDESTGQRGRRTWKTNQSCSLNKVQKVSTRLSKSNSGSHEVSNDERNSQSVIQPYTITIVQDDKNCQGRRVSKNNNIVEKQHCRKTPNLNHDISQDSLNISPIISQSSTSKSEEKEENSDGIGTNICGRSGSNVRKTKNVRAVNEITQDSLDVSSVNMEMFAPVDVSDKCNAIHVERSSNNSVKSKKSVSSEEGKSRVSKTLTLCLTRIDNVYKITNSLAVSDESSKGERSGIERRKSEGIVKKSLCASSISEIRKRSCSYVDENYPSKKKLIDKNVEEVDFVSEPENVKKTSDSVFQGLHSRKSSKLLSNLLPAGNGKKNTFVEITSFADISMQSPEMKVGNYNLFEELPRVDAGEITQDGKDANSTSQTNCMIGSKEGPEPSSGKKSEETGCSVPKCNTPTSERTTSRKGGRSPALFSAYANEPVKNRVAAYEGLSTVTEEVQVPVTNKRVTRTKTRAMAAAAAQAAAAAATAPSNYASQPKVQMNNSNRKSGPTLKITRASWRIKKKIANSAKKHDASKENSFQFNSSKNEKNYKNTSGTGGKILADVNGLFSPGLNNWKKTPMTAPRTIPVNNLSASQVTKSGCRPGVIISNVSTFLKKPVMKTSKDEEMKKAEEQKKREEKEREALRRREEQLKKQAEEKKKKRDEMRLRVQGKREAQEKEKQESQLRVGKEKDEKWHILQQEREAKQKGTVLKKKLESERKAAEARRKIEEAEAARVAKLKMEELQHKKEQEEAAEKDRLKRIEEEKEAALIRLKTEQKAKELAKAAKERAEILKNTVPVPKPPEKVCDVTFTKPLDKTFNSIYTTQSSVDKSNENNAFNLADIQSEESDNEEELPKQSAIWAIKSELFKCSKGELRISQMFHNYFTNFGAPETNISAMFPRKVLKRTSSAIWNTPPRYSVLPKY